MRRIATYILYKIEGVSITVLHSSGAMRLILSWFLVKRIKQRSCKLSPMEKSDENLINGSKKITQFVSMDPDYGQNGVNDSVYLLKIGVNGLRNLKETSWG